VLASYWPVSIYNSHQQSTVYSTYYKWKIVLLISIYCRLKLYHILRIYY
jgi:hypothetical protein